MDFKIRLLQKKQELESIIKTEQDKTMIPLVGSTDGLSNYDEHPADFGSELFEREKNVGLLELYELELEKVRDALEKAEVGQYGICKMCGNPIEAVCLRRLSNTTLCAACARQNQDEFICLAEQDLASTGEIADEGEAFDISDHDFYHH